MANYYNTAATREAENMAEAKRIKSTIVTSLVRPIKHSNFNAILNARLDYDFEQQAFNERLGELGICKPLGNHNYYKDSCSFAYYYKFYKRLMQIKGDDDVFAIPVKRLATDYLELYREFESYQKLTALKGFDDEYEFNHGVMYSPLRIAARRCGMKITQEPQFVEEYYFNKAVSELSGRPFSGYTPVQVATSIEGEYLRDKEKQFDMQDGCYLTEDLKDMLPWCYKYLVIKVSLYREMSMGFCGTYKPTQEFKEIKGFDPVKYRETEGEMEKQVRSILGIVVGIVFFIIMYVIQQYADSLDYTQIGLQIFLFILSAIMGFAGVSLAIIVSDGMLKKNK